MLTPKILAYTVSYGDRDFLERTIPDMRGSAGVWFDWLVCLGNPSDKLKEIAEKSLNHPDKRGIQFLQTWPENRGQHHATLEAVELAKAKGYDWLLRIDDDLQSKTKRWLKKMISNSEDLKKAVDDPVMRIISAPKIIGLKNPLTPVGVLETPGLKFSAEVMELLGGACRLHPVDFIKDFKPNPYAPINRQDPQTIAAYTMEHDGILIRYPQVRMVHRTEVLENQDSEQQAHERTVNKYWPYLGESV